VSLVLERFNVPLGAAKVHGLLCAFMCAGTQRDTDWVQAVLPGLSFGKGTSAREALSEIFALYDFSYQKLHTMTFDFRMLLPNEDERLSVRAKAVSEWCEGFMSGFQLAGLKIGSHHSEDVQDALLHFSEFAALDYESITVSDEDEMAYLEVMEYVRMAVLMIYNEFAGQPEGRGSHDEVPLH